MYNPSSRHSREGGNPELKSFWIPAFAGMTILVFLSFPTFSHAESDDSETTVSTQPIGSPFYRHLANDYNIDIAELVKFEKRGFGRTEIVTLVLLSGASGTPLKEYGRRRVRENVPLRTFAEEAGLDYATVYKVSNVIKEGLEAKGDKNLPPPVFEKPSDKANPKASKRKSEPAVEKSTTTVEKSTPTVEPVKK